MRPSDESWRADALARSRHTRWVDELRAPLDDPDPEKAAEICAAVTRAALRDFAPAILLLDPVERHRARALAAYVLTLFDFASQAGLEGERLAQINRMEFDLEAALGGEPAGQPVFVSMEQAAPWSSDALAEIIASARWRVTQPRPQSERAADEEARRLGSALVEALTGERSEGLTDLAAGLLRLTGLLGLAEDIRRHRPRLSQESLPDDWVRGTARRTALAAAIRRECRTIAPLLTPPDLAGLSPSAKRAARYLRSAGRHLLRSAERAGDGLRDGPPTLGPLVRIGLLLRSFVA